MIALKVMYPFAENISFDVDYYTQKHIPLVLKELGSACKKISVGMADTGNGQCPNYLIITSLHFESVREYEEAFSLSAHNILSDIKNFTEIVPEIEMLDILLES